MKLLKKTSETIIPIKLISQQDYNQQTDLSAPEAAWLKLSGFNAAEGEFATIQNDRGGVERVFFGLGEQNGKINELDDPFNLAKLAQLPAGIYQLDTKLNNAETAYFACGLSSYKFSKYKTDKNNIIDGAKVQLLLPDDLDLDSINAQIEAVSLTRDLVNTPANDLGPAELAQAVRDLAGKFGATYRDIVGDDLLDKGFNLIHTVGRASTKPRAPRFVEMKWQPTQMPAKGGKKLPKLTLVGKGVVFDTGGLDLKPAAGMLTMKKDMGGAANVLGLAMMIMSANLPVELTLLIGAVENSVSADAFRPSDILTSYKGLTIEIGNTDAEGRLVLADLLAYADEQAPDLLMDMATLTGAARVAVGPEIAAYFTKDAEMSSQLNLHSKQVHDPIWQLPLHTAYLKTMNSKLADLNNLSSMPLAGASTAALFLNCFVEQASCYIHWDINSWNISERPARPIGGDAQGIRTIFSMLKQRYK